MKYKTVFIFYSEIEVENGDFPFETDLIRIENIKPPFETDDLIHIKSITHYLDTLTETPIEDIYFQSFTKIELFLAFISLIGYCRAEMVRHILTSPVSCEEHQEFEILSKDIFHNRKFKHGINPEDFKSIMSFKDDKAYLEIALLFLRKSLSTESLEEKIILLYSALERIAAHESEDFVTHTCIKCNFIQVTNSKEVRKLFKKILMDGGALKEEVKLFNDLRNKIAHGGGVRNVKFYSDIKLCLLKIQHIIVGIICKRLNISQTNSQTSIVDLPMAVYKFVKLDNGTYEFADNLSAVLKANAGISKVDGMSEAALNNLTLEIGIYTDSQNLIYKNEFRENYFPQ